ncbi:unnamed protein product [Adineta steineri]|uniref:F-box domain-containing protein n=1 Tax=Adineta steineri TaxID=433720 RepID=A0A814M5S9_9BILA|nr:unnamed protein product [Adineta steineri]CAF1283735.1 unnamed protein product [Adineta steineri]
MEESYLLNLPVELLHHIFDFCDAQTILCKISGVCKKLHSIVNQYHRLHLKLDIHKYITNERSIPHHVLYNRVVSLTTWWTARSEDQKETFISALLQCKRLCHLTLRFIDDTSLQSLFIKANNIKLVSLTIDSNHEPSNTTFEAVSLFLEKSSIQKLCWKNLRYKAEEMLWPKQCKLKFLSIGYCFYNQYASLLHQLPYLETFQVMNFFTYNNSMHVPSFNSQLTCLSIQYCSLSIEHLRSLVLQTPKLCELKLTYYPDMFKSLMEIYEWEKFVRMELSFLKKFQFFIPYKFSENDPVRLDMIIAPFRDSFWLNEKRWFTVCDQTIETYEIDKISIFTIPFIKPVYHSNFGNRFVRCGIASKDNIYYINDQPEDEITLDTVHHTLPVLNLTHKGLKDSHLQILAHALQNNQTTIELNLFANKIKALGTQYLVEALLNNTTLTKLNLDGNYMGDEGAKHIADALNTNQALITLSMATNHIGDEGMSYICKALHKNITLKELDLHQNKITNDGAISLSETLQNNNILEKINLAYNCIGDDGARNVAITLKKNSTVLMVNFNDNSITVPEPKYLFDDLQKDMTDVKLSLEGNGNDYYKAVETALQMKNDYCPRKISLGAGIYDVGAKIIANALQHNTTLEELDLHYNHIEVVGAKYLADALRKNITLRTFNFCSNKIGSAGVYYIAEALRHNTTLSKLKLDSNDSGDEGAKSIADVLNTNKTLMAVSIATNNIGDEGMSWLCKALHKNITLKELDLHQNKITADGAKSLSQVLQNNNTLEKINLAGNNIGDDGARNLATALKTNTSVTILNLNSNKIDITGAQCLYDELQKKTILEELNLRFNQIDIAGAKYLADTLQENTTLKTLDLFGNEIGAAGVYYLIEALRNNPVQSLTELFLYYTSNREHESKSRKSKARENVISLLRNSAVFSQSDFEGDVCGYCEALKIAERIRKNLTSHENFNKKYIGSAGAQYIGDALRYNTSLTILHVNINEIGQNGLKYLADGLKNNTTIETLGLDSYIYSTKELIRIIINILNDPVTLKIKNSPIKKNRIKCFNDILLKSSTLRILNLINNSILSNEARDLCIQNNRIGDDGLTYLSSILKNIKTLETLILSRVNMGPIGTESLANALQNNTTLSILRLNNNRIGVQGIQSLMIILQRNKTLVEIDLSNNQIGNEGTQIVADFLSTNTTLLKLNLGINQIGLSGVKYLGDALEKNTTLTSLYLRRNEIDQNGIEYFSQSLKGNQTLKQLDVSCNPIGYIGIEYLRDLLKTNTTFIELKIGFNYKNYQGNLVNYTNS